MARGLCKRCEMRARRAGRLHEFVAPPRICGHCGAAFEAGSRNGNRYCTFGCQRAAVEVRRQADRAAALSGRRCRRCSEPIPPVARSDARFCGVACQQADWYAANEARLRAAATAWKASNREVANEAEHRRRARKTGNGSERIDRLAVWERDRGHCWICERSIDPELAFPHPLSPSLDHVIPLNRGGGHLMDNVAMSHLRCNISKQDKILDRVPAWAA